MRCEASAACGPQRALLAGWPMAGLDEGPILRRSFGGAFGEEECHHFLSSNPILVCAGSLRVGRLWACPRVVATCPDSSLSVRQGAPVSCCALLPVPRCSILFFLTPLEDIFVSKIRKWKKK